MKKTIEHKGHLIELVECPENASRGIYPIQIYVDGKDFGADLWDFEKYEPNNKELSYEKNYETN